MASDTIQGELKPSNELSVMIGMVNVSFNEAQTSLQGENQTTPASGSVSSINGMLHYRFKTEDRIAWFTQFSFPLIASQGSYLGGGGGLEYYWGKSPAKMNIKDATTSFTLTPITRFYALGALNMGYLAYLTETAKKNDTLLEVELGGGLSRKFKYFTLRSQASVARGVGVTTSTLGMKFMLGGIFFLD
jgi:hypothetical protein